MEMIGYWVQALQYRIVHPVTRRTQDLIFEREREDLDLIVKYCKEKAKKELASPKPPTPEPVRRYNVPRTLTALRAYEEWKTGRWEIPTAKEQFEMKPTWR